LENYPLEGDLEFRISRGSHTKQFLIENFKDSIRDDIIYITANPHVDILLNRNFYKIISVWKDGWSDKFHTVLPNVMYEYSVETIKKYPNKKMIIHFMQPHYPYIDENQELRALQYLRESILYNKNKPLEKIKKIALKEEFWALYSYYVYKILDIESHIRGYWKNLQITLPYVEKLITLLSGTTIITADHGEAFGEYIHPIFPIKYYGHRDNVRIPILVKVPWFIIKKERKVSFQNGESAEKDIILKTIKELRSQEKL
jgi:hypothetical protein